MGAVNVLYVYGDILQHGGIDNFMMNYFRHIDRRLVHIDFALQGVGPGVYDREIKAAGSDIYYLPKPRKNPMRYLAELRKVYGTGKYKIVHTHCDAMNYRVLKLAKECGIPVRISHAHNTAHVLPKNFWAKHLFYEYSRRRGGKYATVRWACSKAAGEWMYGTQSFSVVPNAIELEHFLFDADKRQEMRDRYRLPEDAIVLGHVGRFDTQKNQGFLVNLLRKLKDGSEKKYRLLFLGAGWMRAEVEAKVKQHGLEDSVLFAGEVPNPQDYYHMMDIFVMPSLFEGYGIALEEAEVNGLPCFASDKVPQEVDVLGHIRYLPLDLTVWQKGIEAQVLGRRKDLYRELKQRGYDIADAARNLQEAYIRLYKEAVGSNG